MSEVRLGTQVRINPHIAGRLSLLAEGIIGSPKVSGDGRVEVWDQVTPGGEAIMRWQGGQVENISRDPRSAIFPRPSRSGDVVAWTQFSSQDADDPKGRWEIHQWRNGTTSVVAASPTANLFDPAVSGNGRVFAWDNDGNGRMATWNVQRQKIGGPVEDVTRGRHYCVDPVLDYRGRRIVFTNADSGRSQIWMADGHQAPAAVAPSAGFQSSAGVTPFGGTVLFSDTSTGLGQVVQVRPSHPPHEVAPAPKQDQWLAAESATGHHVVWSNIDRTQEPSPMELFVQDGHRPPQQLTQSGGGLNTFPSISDDGRVITWLWVDPDNTSHARVYRFERD